MLFCECSVAEKYNYLGEKFTCAYEWLRKTDLLSLKAGSYPIMGNDVVANMQEYTTFPSHEGYFETHERFFDIQYVVSGIERIGICKREGLVVRSADKPNDLILYEEPECSGSIILMPGDLVVVAPEDAHKPRCQAGKEPCAVKKVVVKIAI